MWATTELGSYMMQYLYHGLDTPVSYKPEFRSKAAAAYSLSQFHRRLDALETRLAGRDYLLGGFSLVDAACASWLGFGSMFGRSSTATPAWPPGTSAAASERR